MAIVIKAEKQSGVDMLLGDIPEGETFMSDMDETWVYVKAGSIVVGLHNPPSFWTAPGLLFHNYRAVDIEISAK